MQTANCERCYRRKSKCDRLQPCTQCHKSGSQCFYKDRAKQRTVRSDIVDRLERRLSQAENRNKTLAAELSRICSAERTQRTAESARRQSELRGPEADLDRSSDLVAQVSLLSNGAAGERQYLGSASGVLFANLVRAGIDIPNSGQLSPPYDRDDLLGPTHIPEHLHVEVPRELPPKKLAERLVWAYLDHDYLSYPFLIPADIKSFLERLYEQGTGALTAYELFVIDMVFAISTTQISKDDCRQLPSAESHHTRAMSSITDVLRLGGGLHALHAILLLCQYRTNSSIQDNSGSMWQLVGTAARMCFEMGLHKDSSYPLQGPGDNVNSARRYAIQESKRLSFWSVLCMDRITSLILGRPCAIRVEDFDHACPTANTVALAADESNQDTRPFVFYHLVQYRLLCGRIVSTLHRKRSSGLTDQDVLQMRLSLCTDLAQWKQNIEQLHLGQDSQMSPSCFSAHEWYDLLYSNAMLIIWRPAPLLPDVSDEPDSLQHIFDSAKQSITIYARLHKSRKLNYSWITLQTLFLAGLSYVYACSRHYRSRWRNASQPCLHTDPTTIEIVNDTRACSNVLVAVSERWNTLRNCHSVFDRLADAVLSDAIKLQAAQAQSAVESIRNSISQPLNNTSLDQMQMSTPLGPPTVSPLAVDTEFLHCFDDLQSLYNMQQIENPIMELGQNWLGYIGNGPQLPDPSYQMHLG